MRLITVLCLYFFIGLSSAKANLIHYQFDTLTFSDSHQVSGAFSYNTDDKQLISLYVSLFGPTYNIDFDKENLVAPDAFSISFENMTFGDSADEGFQLFKNDVYLVTGEFGYGAQDTCYFDPEVCAGNLLTFQSEVTYANAPPPIYLLAFGLIVLIGRQISA